MSERKTIADKWLYDSQFYAPELITHDFFYQWLIKTQPNQRTYSIQEVEAIAREAFNCGCVRTMDFEDYWKAKKAKELK